MTERLSTYRPSLGNLAPVVLVAENDSGVREVLLEVLQMDRLRVLLAQDGEEALTLADSWMVDLLVTDVVMPRLDGFGLIRGVRRLYPGLPVLVTSGDPFYQGRPLAEATAEFGVEATFFKPFNIDDLQRAVRTAVFHNREAKADMPSYAPLEAWSPVALRGYWPPAAQA